MDVYAPHARSILWGQTDFGQRIFCVQRLERNAEQKLRHLKTRKVSIRGGTYSMCRFCMQWGQTCCQTNMCDENIFHSSTKFIALYIYSIYLHSHTWEWDLIFRFLTKAQKAAI